jgi:hypothetical protein
MKKIILYLIIVPIVALVSSCKKEIMEYKGTEGVYFAVRWGNVFGNENKYPYQPFSSVDFVRIAQDFVEYPLNVSITGPVKDYDRTFILEVNPDSTTAVLGRHYDAPKREWSIPAGAVSTLVKVKIHRTPDLEETPVTLGLRLVETTQLAISFPSWDAIKDFNDGPVVEKFDASLHTLRINDIMVQPAVWSGSIQSGNRESGLFGVFSRRKMEFLMENFGYTYEDFANDQVMPIARQFLVALDAALLLEKRFNEKNPVLEADGRLMWMGNPPWTSYIGVPYVPSP